MYEEAEPITLSGIMKKPVHIASPSAPLKEAISVMYEKKIGSIVVVADELPVGIFTERDLVKVVNNYVERIEHPIGESMHRQVVTLDLSENPTRGLIIMAEKRITHLPVVEKGKVVGIVTQKDLVAWFMKRPAVLLGL